MSENIESPTIACLFYTQKHLFASLSICFWFRFFSIFRSRSIEIAKFIFEDKVQIQSIEIKRLCQQKIIGIVGTLERDANQSEIHKLFLQQLALFGNADPTVNPVHIYYPLH